MDPISAFFTAIGGALLGGGASAGAGAGIGAGIGAGATAAGIGAGATGAGIGAGATIAGTGIVGSALSALGSVPAITTGLGTAGGIGAGTGAGIGASAAAAGAVGAKSALGTFLKVAPGLFSATSAAIGGISQASALREQAEYQKKQEKYQELQTEYQRLQNIRNFRLQESQNLAQAGAGGGDLSNDSYAQIAAGNNADFILDDKLIKAGGRAAADAYGQRARQLSGQAGQAVFGGLLGAGAGIGKAFTDVAKFGQGVQAFGSASFGGTNGVPYSAIRRKRGF